jgi:hypothetical protein
VEPVVKTPEVRLQEVAAEPQEERAGAAARADVEAAAGKNRPGAVKVES